MRKVLFWLMITILLAFSISLNEQLVFASSYGWGYKKNNNHKLPDIGKYEKILQKYGAHYADLSGEKDIYLTFDNGYEQGYTSSILNVLKEESVPATFFVT